MSQAGHKGDIFSCLKQWILLPNSDIWIGLESPVRIGFINFDLDGLFFLWLLGLSLFSTFRFEVLALLRLPLPCCLLLSLFNATIIIIINLHLKARFLLVFIKIDLVSILDFCQNLLNFDSLLLWQLEGDKAVVLVLLSQDDNS